MFTIYDDDDDDRQASFSSESDIELGLPEARRYLSFAKDLKAGQLQTKPLFLFDNDNDLAVPESPAR
ncbi:hypothetical protein FBU30_009369 [Linnemannia zychae]|nr:hypothetical protein FBU30_009369 [Linnemannia zychae]